ncbi:MAG TPA: VOC family protein [Caulobacteraceae bacterium]|jgi:predicted 3-demethylubiquinone-9 3-methyltransferase (glyoxalase superfamily)|nr:VOC family protein [Caulobacteraceae bacterium]
MSKLSLCLWFDKDGEDAANFYVQTFRQMGREAAIGKIARYGPAGPGPQGSVMTVTFTLDGLEFMALNGGPIHQHSHAVSLMVACADQAELDGFWSRLLDSGREVQCGWLTDRFGFSWQIVPADLEHLISGDQGRSNRVMAALMDMVKIDIAALERAAAA